MRNLKIFLTLLVVTWMSFPAFACWSQPQSYEVISENGKYRLAVAIPEKENKAKSTITVFVLKDNRWEREWELKAINALAPSSAYITEDGSTVITIGNWYGKDEGPYELVVYKNGKLLTCYSVENLLGKPFKPRFHSTAGQEWLTDSFKFFDEKNKKFCIWVDVEKQWVVINLADGKLIKPDNNDISSYEDKIRKFAYDKIKEGKNYYRHYQKIARFIRPEDKPLFEKLLSAPDSGMLGCGYVDSSERFEYRSSNRTRELAEMVLATLEEEKQIAIHDFNEDKDFKNLGILRISADFDKAPRKNEGMIVLWLEPVGQKEDAKKKERPAHDIGIDLKYNYPYNLEKKDAPLKLPVQIVMYAITPGKYRIKGYWKTDIESSLDINGDYWQKTGDFIIKNAPEVEIFKGKSTSAKVSFKK